MLRVGLIGLGGMGRGRLGYYAQMPDARVEAVADVRVDELRHDSAIAGRLELPAEQVRWFQDYRDLVAQRRGRHGGYLLAHLRAPRRGGGRARRGPAHALRKAHGPQRWPIAMP